MFHTLTSFRINLIFAFTGTSVFTVAAHDQSLMENNVKYTIISEHEDIFYIHPITGKLAYHSSFALKSVEALGKYFPQWSYDYICINIIQGVSGYLFKFQ